MGTWGHGNFDNDTAADHLEILTGRLIAEVAEAMAGDPVEIEPDEYWGVAVPCNLELLYLIAKQNYVGVSLVGPDIIADWKAKFLAVWDETVDELEPAAGYKKERRAVLVRTFDQLAEQARTKQA